MKKQLIFIFIILFLTISFTYIAHASAANLSFSVPQTTSAGETVTLAVILETGGTVINSAELSIEYNEELLSFTGYRDENSVIKLWIEPPRATDGKIYLSGIIPGGVFGVYNSSSEYEEAGGIAPLPLVDLIFEAKTPGTATFTILDSKILEHDGFGTPLPHESLGALIQIHPGDISGSETETTEGEMKNEKEKSAAVWILLLLLMCSIIAYKLLKYRHAK